MTHISRVGEGDAMTKKLATTPKKPRRCELCGGTDDVQKVYCGCEAVANMCKRCRGAYDAA